MGCLFLSLQMQLYQLTRLLYDHNGSLYEHFERHDIAPTLYAAPWFLTLFASQFPISFVTRLFGKSWLGFDFLFKLSIVVQLMAINHIMRLLYVMARHCN